MDDDISNRQKHIGNRDKTRYSKKFSYKNTSDGKPTELGEVKLC